MSVNSVSSGTHRKMEKDISLVPWYNAAQFKKVYEYLYSPELVKKRWAVDQISVWETRCHPSLPTAIEASLVIVRAIIQDILLTNGASLCQERDIQMMYSMALVRFVNLTIETHKKLQPSVVTTSQIAKGLGIPSWIVDLRNEATHSFWPSLPSLRMAAETAMKYLNDSFWEKESSALKNLEKEPLDEKYIRELIHSYITLQFHILKDKERCNMQSEKFWTQDAEECKTVLEKLAFCVQKYKRQFINILISDGLFIPFDDDLKNLMSPDESLQYQDVYDENFTGSRSIPPVPVELENLWRRLLYMLNMVQAIPSLLEALLKSQADRSEMGKKLVISWAMKILRIHTLGDCYEENSLKKIFRKKGIIVNWRSLFNAAVSRPCLYTPYIFPMIFIHLDLKESVTRYILNLMAIALGQADWKSVKLPTNYPIYTVEHLKQMKRLQDAKRENKTKSGEECIWSVAQDSCYKSWPIGFVLNPVVEDKTEDQFEDYIPIEYFEKMDFTEKCFLSNENDNEEEEEYFVVNNQPNSSEDEMELSERPTFLYRKK